jgi:hypothetical protein
MRLRRGKEIILGISDAQAPFQHKDTLKFLGAIKEEFKPTKVVDLGDSIDNHSFSSYLKDPTGMSPREEYNKAMKYLEAKYELFPEGVEVYSNHVARIDHKVQEAGLLPEFMKPMREILGMPEGWDIVENITIDGIKFEHGDRAGGIHAAIKLEQANRKSTVIGHHHSHGGINYSANDDVMTFAANAGCLIDVDAYAFKYGKKYPSKPTLGTIVIVYGVPRFIPMLLTRRGRWTGELI